jgi:two-component system, LytTR family, response regulator
MEIEIATIIVEDVESYLFTIEKLVNEVAPFVKIVAKTTSLVMAEKLITEMSPKLVLLDIQFEEEGRTAFDMLKSLAEKGSCNFKLIFITAHHEVNYYSKAFEFGALHFLEKPIDKKKLKEAIDRISTNDHTFQLQDMMLQVFRDINQKQTSLRSGKMIIEGAKFNELIDISNIVIVEASGRYSNIQMANGQHFLVTRNLGEYEKRLQIYPNFFRIHHNKIINLNFIKRFSKKERMVELVSPFGNHFASKERFKEFVVFLEKYSLSDN